MNIVMNKTYMVFPRKWGTTEEELMVGEANKQFIVRTEWKRGQFLVTPKTEDEVEALQTAVDTEEDDNELVSSFFEEFEIYETSDGNNEMDFSAEFDDEEAETIQEAYDEDWIAGLNELGYDTEDGWFTLWGNVMVEEYEDSNSE